MGSHRVNHHLLSACNLHTRKPLELRLYGLVLVWSECIRGVSIQHSPDPSQGILVTHVCACLSELYMDTAWDLKMDSHRASCHLNMAVQKLPLTCSNFSFTTFSPLLMSPLNKYVSVLLNSAYGFVSSHPMEHISNTCTNCGGIW